jgi:hypothetical protein
MRIIEKALEQSGLSFFAETKELCYIAGSQSVNPQGISLWEGGEGRYIEKVPLAIELVELDEQTVRF